MALRGSRHILKSRCWRPLASTRLVCRLPSWTDTHCNKCLTTNKPQPHYVFSEKIWGKHFHSGVSLQSNTQSTKVTGTHSDNVTIKDNGLELQYGEYSMDILYMWLRDHCRCEDCYNHATFQKKSDNYSVLDVKAPAAVEFDGMVLLLHWHDGHVTSFNIEWLVQNTYHEKHTERVESLSWNREIILSEGLPVVPSKDVMGSQDGLRKHLYNLVKYGFSIVSGVASCHEGTLEVARKVSFFQETHFGADWSFTANNERGDTAYTNLSLGAHTDNTYFTSPSGIQVFHVLEHIGDGGQTLLVDGQYCAEQLRLKHPKSFEYLTNAVVPHEYFEDELKIRSLGTVLSVHPTTERFRHIRFNPYDRSPLFTLSNKEQEQFYKSYQNLTDEIRDSDNEFYIKLRPGMVLFVDNWRVLHGRKSFTGKRTVSGCYLPRDDWTGLARQLGLLSL